MAMTFTTADSDGYVEGEILKTDVLGRVRIPASKRESILDAFERSGMSGVAFARHIGVKYPTFATWVQGRRRARGDYPNADCKDVKAPLALVEAVVDGGGDCGMGVEVEAPGGLKLRVRDRGDVALAAELLRALQA